MTSEIKLYIYIYHQTGKANSETLDLIKTKISELFIENAQICPQ